MSATTISRIRPVTSQTPQLTESSLTSTSLSNSTGSNSESSDPVESDYSEEEVEEEEESVSDEEEEDEEEEEEEDEEDSGSESDDEAESEEEQSTGSSTSVEEAKQERKYLLDDFQMIKTIGTGTFGRVCLCKDKQTDTFGAMKILTMTDVIRLKQVEHVKNEKNILAEVDHPFIVNMLWSTKDDCCLYMLFEYVCGGELFTYLRNAGRFSASAANFYATEIILALEYLHSLMIVYRDLKPENLLINRDGHLKITDFGFAKKLRDRTWTLCGTPEYLAPEIIQSKGHNRAVDWWALGILIYEMIIGYPPFYDDNPFGIYEKILSGKIDWPKNMDPVAKDLVKKLLVLDRTKRLGNMKNGADDVKKHRWFKNINWTDVLNKKTQPPIIPEVHFEGDTSNFDEYPETDWKAARSLDESDMQLFDDF
ncbi:cAMP-dependent protein kinase catalytic subunit 3 [Hermetia illucens]|uniref:cAMP-dependent protein kinase catalytic subunit 3 n=1 Tax=Hermetia illucens TaxID=343691 RepID=UPI0018CBF6D8|nr:cAMP-dependent protein kinase catalytic subunit 3 [Hermetia illucens]XP_037906847.1 cAMP-dependent protein kinase catalytic subunit 3 [Hermetia illucens]XP_037906848.1 cAMP-dependent protein kinase catalytic subunit 3 [Hermetia illucens]XP_037906849.1 cAMP-dependent protein kinase catalytic subunit 3 [Hermetia illucens]XP_037906850.1 cAMP-dependent protein kinase catalytic subunit 3 [Hermetia illucens]